MERMNSCLYRCSVTHHRVMPLRHHFVYNMFLFYIDLDELPLLHHRLQLLSHNRKNIYSFRDSDHLRFSSHGNTGEQIRRFVRRHGVDLTGGKIFLLTHLRTLGHIFNPVSFYFCFDTHGNSACAVAEVGNTLGELKPFFFGSDAFQNNTFALRTTKYFYVSPFLDLDTEFDFRLQVPGETLRINIDSRKKDNGQILHSSLVGKKVKLTDGALLQYALRFPAITLQVIGAIHWQAFRLYLKGLPFQKKGTNMHLQREVYRGPNA